MAIIRRAEFATDSPAVLTIWREFIANSPVNLDYQNDEVEFANFTEKYAAPRGCVLLAEADGVVDPITAAAMPLAPLTRDYILPLSSAL